MLRINLTKKEENELLKLRKKANDYRSERALCVLLNSEGHTSKEISRMLKRSYFTVRNWLLSFKDKRVCGLNRAYSSGRPSDARKQLSVLMEKWLKESPEKYGFIQNCWNVKLIIRMFELQTGKLISSDTVERALKDSGFSYKRPKKTVRLHAPSKEAKLLKINSLIKEIKGILLQEDAEVFSIDESHFSAEPYLVKGWYKKGERFFPTDTKEKAGLHNLWCIKFKNKIFLLEELTKRKC